jgi:hypothetical protein
MVIILVHWLIKKGCEDEFVLFWETQMKIAINQGLYRETLTAVDDKEEDLKFHTFPIESPHYSTFINIGMWNSLEDFDREVGQYIPKTKNSEDGQTITLKNFEFKMRERIVLKVLSDRGIDLPKPKLIE